MGNSPNLQDVIDGSCCQAGVVGPDAIVLPDYRRVTNPDVSRSELESSAIEGESPVHENVQDSLSRFLSTMGHVKPYGNLGGPSSKAKYEFPTDSEKVP